MAKHKQWFPFEVGLYLANTKRLTMAQHGAYLLLMLSYWEEGAIPNDESVLQSICVCNADAMHNVLHVLEKHFDLVDDHWRHGAMDELKAAQEAKYLKRKEAAEKRWSNADENAYAMHEQGASVSVSNISSSIKRIVDEKFPIFWDACPKRGKASNPKMPALEKFTRLVRDGQDVDALIAAAERWRANDEEEGIAGTAKTAQVQTWLNQHRWEDAAEDGPSVNVTDIHETWKQRITDHFHSGAEWRSFWGPKPGEPGCQVPAVVQEWWAGENIPAFLDRRARA